jgi:hypothetical protein
MATVKPAATDILIDDNVQDLDSTVSIDKHDEVSPGSVFPRFSTPYRGICSSVLALLAAGTPPGSTGTSTANPHEYLDKLAHELPSDKLADIVSNPTPVPDDINTNSLKIEFIIFPEHKQELLLQHDSTMLESSVASKEYIDFYKMFTLLGQFTFQGQSTPNNVLPFSIQTFFQWKLYPIG